MCFRQVLEENLGKKVERSIIKGEQNPRWLISFENKNNFCFYCVFRLEFNNKVLTTSFCDIYPENDALTYYIKQLEGRKLISFDYSEQYDCILFFEDNYTARFFCNLFIENEEDKCSVNWKYNNPNKKEQYEFTEKFQLRRLDCKF